MYCYQIFICSSFLTRKLQNKFFFLLRTWATLDIMQAIIKTTIAGWGKKNNVIYGVKKNKPFFYVTKTAKFNFSHMVFKVVSAGYFGQIFQNLHVPICNYGFLNINGQKKVKNNFFMQLVNF